jgi:predicted acetyltransferase
MTIEYRNPTAEEGIVPALSTTFNAFGETIRPYDAEQMPKLMPTDRVISAFDDGKPVGTCAAYRFQLTIPGGELPMGGVTWVGVLPSHRRRGVMSELMRRQIDAFHEGGEPLAGLWASETAIYGRFGYGISAPGVYLKADCANFRFRDDPDPVGVVRLIERGEAATIFRPIREHVRAARPGMISRPEDGWDVWHLADEEFMRHGYGPKFYAVYERDGTAEGYVMYRVKQKWDDGIPRGELSVREMYAISPVAERELWRFLFGVDLTTRVEADLLDPASPLFLMVVDARRLQLNKVDGLWLRLVDVDAALSARSYEGDDSLVVEVSDAFCPWNEGRYRVGTSAGRTKDAADLRVDVADLASVYLGGFSFEALADALRVEEVTDGAIPRASRLFATQRPPWCAEVF